MPTFYKTFAAIEATDTREIEEKTTQPVGSRSRNATGVMPELQQSSSRISEKQECCARGVSRICFCPPIKSTHVPRCFVKFCCCQS